MNPNFAVLATSGEQIIYLAVVDMTEVIGIGERMVAWGSNYWIFLVWILCQCGCGCFSTTDAALICICFALGKNFRGELLLVTFGFMIRGEIVKRKMVGNRWCRKH